MPALNRTKLTQRFVDTVKPPAEGEQWFMDTEVRGFGLRVRSNGKKTYGIRWASSRKMTLGDATTIKLEDAREMAILRLGEVIEGEDPVANREAWKKNPTVEDLGAEVVEFLKTQGRSEAYVKESERLLNAYVVPAIGTHRVREVTVKELEKIIHGLKAKPRTGNLVRSLLSRMFKLARKWTYRLDDPTMGIEPFEEHARERHYSLDELAKIRGVLEERMGIARFRQSAGACLLLLFTGARPREAFGATWVMFDLEAGTWTKPSQHTKQKKVHAHKLAQEALEVLKALRAAAEVEAAKLSQEAGKPVEVSPFVFPSDSKAGHLTTIKKFWAEVCKKAEVTDARLYDLRKTFATLLLSRGVDIKTVMKLTGHTQATTLLKHYAMVVGGAEEKALEGLFG